MTPIEKAAQVQQNSMRKEHLKQEYVKYFRIVLNSRFHECEDESPKS